MSFARRWVTMFGFAAIAHASTAIPCAHAQEPTGLSTEPRNVARRFFEQGERAFEAHDYVLAAKAFDEAYRVAPHYASLWNAARSWERAGEQTRAANGYAKYLRSAPADAPDRDAAMVALAALTEKLGRIEVYAAEVNEVRIDDELLDGAMVYVHPGMHVIEGQSGGTKIRRTEMVDAGSVRSVALVDDKTVDEMDSLKRASTVHGALRTPPRSTATPPMIKETNRASNWFGPAAIVTGGMTIASASLVLWSGIDTLSSRREFDAAPTTDKLAEGKDKQFRTNLFLGALITSGMATGVFVSLWKWNGSTINSAVTVLPPVMGLPTQISFSGSF